MQLPKIKLPDKAQIRTYVQDFRRDVIRMMRLKFICMAMMILIAVFLIMLTSINIIMNTVSRSQSQKLLKQIAESERYSSVSGMGGERETGGERPEPPPGETFPEGRQRPTEPDGQDASGDSETAENMRFSEDGSLVPPGCKLYLAGTITLGSGQDYVFEQDKVTKFIATISNLKNACNVVPDINVGKTFIAHVAIKEWDEIDIENHDIFNW